MAKTNKPSGAVLNSAYAKFLTSAVNTLIRNGIIQEDEAVSMARSEQTAKNIVIERALASSGLEPELIALVQHSLMFTGFMTALVKGNTLPGQNDFVNALNNVNHIDVEHNVSPRMDETLKFLNVWIRNSFKNTVPNKELPQDGSSFAPPLQLSDLENVDSIAEQDDLYDCLSRALRSLGSGLACTSEAAQTQLNNVNDKFVQVINNMSAVDSRSVSFLHERRSYAMRRQARLTITALFLSVYAHAVFYDIDLPSEIESALAGIEGSINNLTDTEKLLNSLLDGSFGYYVLHYNKVSN